MNGDDLPPPIDDKGNFLVPVPLAEASDCPDKGPESSISIYWKKKNSKTGIVGLATLDRTVGTFIDLGEGNWIYVGTCSGTNLNNHVVHPITFQCRMEYNDRDKSLLWAIDEFSEIYIPVTETSPSIKMRSDINGNPKAITVDTYLNMQGNVIHPNSWTVFNI